FARQYVITPEVRRRFTGSESTIQFNRGINFLNVEYVVTGGTDGRFLRYLAGVEWSENYNTSSVTIGGQTESVLNTGEANPIRATVRVPPGQRSVFDITLGVDPMVWACA